MASDLHLFEKHGVNAQLLYGVGPQAPTMVLSGATQFGGFAVEHALLIINKGQKLKLLVLCESAPPFDLIVRNNVSLPPAGVDFRKRVMALKGLRLGISVPGSSADTGLRLLLKEAGLNPERDVSLVPIGDSMTQLAALKNNTVDGTMAFEPIQTQAVLGNRTSKSVVNLEKGNDGPEIYREYAFNGLFARDDYVRDHPEIAHKVVDSVVEAEQLINDPSRIADVTRVAMNHMHGISKELLTDYITSYRAIFEPVASHQAIDNVNQSLQFAGQLKTPIPYKEVVDTAYMPTSFPEKK